MAVSRICVRDWFPYPRTDAGENLWDAVGVALTKMKHDGPFFTWWKGTLRFYLLWTGKKINRWFLPKFLFCFLSTLSCISLNSNGSCSCYIQEWTGLWDMQILLPSSSKNQRRLWKAGPFFCEHSRVMNGRQHNVITLDWWFGSRTWVTHKDSTSANIYLNKRAGDSERFELLVKK